MISRPDAVSTVLADAGFRIWVLFQHPDLYADGWPSEEFEIVAGSDEAAMEAGCSDDG